MATACVVGSTGLVGSHILSILLNHPAIFSIQTFSRRPLPPPSYTKLHVLENADSPAWPNQVPSECSIFISALGSTARSAGGFDKQRKIDYDLNLALCQSAKQKGQVRVYVLISTAAADPKSMFPYPRMKGELDEAVKAVWLEHCIILKPGLLIGDRQDSRPGEFAARRVASFLGAVSGNRLKDSWAQDADVVAKAAVSVAIEALRGQYEKGVKVVEQNEIVRLGRTEWRSGI